MKAKCTPSKQRRITRWEHQAVIEAMQRRLDEMPDAMRVRRSIVEHVFGCQSAPKRDPGSASKRDLLREWGQAYPGREREGPARVA